MPYFSSSDYYQRLTDGVDTVNFFGKVERPDKMFRKVNIALDGTRYEYETGDTKEFYRVEVKGHCDRSVNDNEARNLVLSSNRAAAVKERLVRFHRIPADRIVISGLGSSMEKYPDTPGDVKNRNRRVEFLLK